MNHNDLVLMFSAGGLALMVVWSMIRTLKTILKYFTSDVSTEEKSKKNEKKHKLPRIRKRR